MVPVVVVLFCPFLQGAVVVRVITAKQSEIYGELSGNSDGVALLCMEPVCALALIDGSQIDLRALTLELEYLSLTIPC